MSNPSVSLLELNEQIKETLRASFGRAVWVRAEISELHENATGHAYFELIEKDANTDKILAKTKATCWSSTYRMIKPYFEGATGERLRSGMKVLVACSVEYHELYGMSLNVKDIDPSFTLGDMARQRMEIIRQLKEDGVIDMNKDLPLSQTPQRIAIVSSASAAGYGDFMDQLQTNAGGYAFYTKLFPAVMQGDNAASSIIQALDQIFEHQAKFDAVIIIRGGGATAELACFDNYELAFNCTQFPLPIITGIGHERDESIVDMVAHTRCKTPTAVAEFLISRIDEAMERVFDLQHGIISLTQSIMQNQANRLQRVSMQFPRLVKELMYVKRTHLASISNRLKHASSLQTKDKLQLIEKYKLQLLSKTQLYITKNKHKLSLLEHTVKLSSPELLLKKGYSLTIKDGKILRSVSQVKAGDKITTRLNDGEIISNVE